MDHSPFGVFNPRFYGVSLHLSDPDRLNLQGRYVDASDDLSDWEGRNAEPSLHDVSVLSAIDHEIRHFHDFLVSPFGTVTMTSRLQASVNGFHVLKTLRECPGRFVPVPLVRWIEWDASARQRWLDSTGSVFGIRSSDDIVELPHVPDVARAPFPRDLAYRADASSNQRFLIAAALIAAQAYGTMEVRRKHRSSLGDISASADDIFEATAHLVQVQAAWSGQGEAAANTLLEYVMTSPATLLAPLQALLKVMLASTGRIDVAKATALCTWMLLGPGERSMAEGHPGHRYFQVLVLAAATPVDKAFSEPMPASNLFARLDKLTHSAPWRANIASASEGADGRLALYEEGARSLQGGYFDALFAVVRAWHHDQAFARRMFLDDPGTLANPDHNLHSPGYPRPFIETRMGFMMHKRRDVLDRDDHRVIAIDEEGKHVLAYISSPGRDTTLDIDDALAARVVTHMSDFLFMDEPLDDLYEHWCRRLIEPFVDKKLVSVY
ncbi:hypothetical protein [Caballeronia novacaledonica]|uniref:Uncharacterized protein n=1 Tax=Caballeronia novacaledonica TaxID=1544861 RepID=A0AA37IMA4_9BURK|nr:hypothetical protein [Caballeronia novacaledonica]GJH28955.1 hypothetical protein CBA19CS42_30585 [Caballeronia novacaledonica]